MSTNTPSKLSPSTFARTAPQDFGYSPDGSALDLSIERLREDYHRNAITPSDVVQTVYTRIANRSDKTAWITLIDQDVALERARELSQQCPEADARPPLYGIPFSVKDSIDIAGMPTTLACPSYAYTATTTAPVVQRILDAGGILIGKTNLDQFATGLNGTRSPYGAPRCVRDPEYISGGSSSGGAVSVGAHLVSFAVATDTAGSTRVPAALNGLVGLKPTLGTISTVGMVPACKTADCITVIAPTIETARCALDVMQSYDEDDEYAREPNELACLAEQPAWSLSELTISVRYGLPPQSLVDSALSPPYASLFSRFLASLGKTEMILASTFDYAPFDQANNMLYGSSIVSQRIVAFKDYLDVHGFDKLNPVVKDIFEASAGFDAVKAYEDIFTLKKYRRLAHKQFRDGPSSAPVDPEADERIDVLIVPSTTTHPTVEEMLADPLALNKRLGTFTHFVNLLDLCAVSVPLTVSWKSNNGESMPFGVTLIALPGRDRDLLGLGKQLMMIEV
jgi:allophanate hydrolase